MRTTGYKHRYKGSSVGKGTKELMREIKAAYDWIKVWLKSGVVAFQFLTRIPLPIHVDYNAATVSRSIFHYPLVGLTIGSLVYVIIWVLPTSHSLLLPLNAALALLLWKGLSGGLHLDGLMDTADGLGSYRSRERMLEIMKDSRVGAMGVLAAFFVLIIQWAALWALIGWSTETGNNGTGTRAHVNLFLLLVALPLVSRWWMTCAIFYWPYIGGDKGMGSLFSDVGARLWIASTLVFSIALIPFLLYVSAGWVVVIVQIGVGWLAATYFSKRLGGLTGDTYGALNELVETAGLISAAYILVG
jgi:adenosylcobinamide-GDP ribazoletransferase